MDRFDSLSPTKENEILAYCNPNIKCKGAYCRGCRGKQCLYLEGIIERKEKENKKVQEIQQKFNEEFLKNYKSMNCFLGLLYTKFTSPDDWNENDNFYLFLSLSLSCCYFVNRFEASLAVRVMKKDAMMPLVQRLGYRCRETGKMYLFLSIFRALCQQPLNRLLVAYYKRGRWVVKYYTDDDSYAVSIIKICAF